MRNLHKNFTTIILSFIILTTIFSYGFSFSKLNYIFAEDFIMGEINSFSTSYPNDTSSLSRFVIKNENEFLFTNTAQNKVVIWNENNTDEIVTFNSGDTFVSPNLVTVLPNGEVYVHDAGRRLVSFNPNYEFNTIYNRFYPQGLFLGRLSSITSDLKNNLYILDYENNVVLKKGVNSTELTTLVTGENLGFTLNSNSQIIVSPNGEHIYLANINSGNNLFLINNSLLSLTQIDTITYGITTISEVAIDCANNLFILEKNITLSSIHKLTKNTYAYESYLTVVGNKLNSVSSFNINVESGEIFIINASNNTLSTVAPTNYTGTFTENISGFVHPIDYTLTSALTQTALIYSVKSNDVPLLQTPYNITPLVSLVEDENVILLSNTVENNSDYAYVLYANSSTNKNIAGYVLKGNLQLLVNTTPEYERIRILNNDTVLYKYPTSLNSSSLTPIFIETIDKNEELTTLNHVNEFTDSSGNRFYAVQINGTSVAYVRVCDVVASELPIIVPTLFTNAEITITDNTEEVFVYSDYNNLATLLPYTLSNSNRIYIESYDSEEAYTQVTFLNSDNEEVTGYIQTKYIKVYSDYNNLLQAFILFMVSFVLIVILFILKTRKKVEE